MLRAFFGRIREFLLNNAFLFSSNNGELNEGGARRWAAAVNPVPLHARPNLNPMGALRRRRRGQGRGGGSSDGNWMPEFVVMAPNLTCLYPCKGNCHAFVVGPHRAAVLDMLFPPYNEGNGRECTYYKRRQVPGRRRTRATTIVATVDGGQRWTLVALKLIDQPDDFNCLGRSYRCFGLDQRNNCIWTIDDALIRPLGLFG